VSTAAAYPSPLKRGLITITMMAVLIMQILDTTIANVALPHMQAALGATPETIIWVLTSYILASAVATPITGWLEARIGRRSLFLIAILGFTASSVLCAVSVSLPMMVAARTLQGIFGAFVVPLGQATMIDTCPPEKRAQSLMILTIGMTTSPIMGPILGGWITDSYGWRWVFYINIPVGLLGAIGVWFLIDDVPLPKRRFDMMGFALLTIALATLQLMLDRGAQLDWFHSPEILIEIGLCIAAAWMFIVHSITSPAPLIPAALFRDRNFLLATFFLMLQSGIVYSGIAQLAPMLQILFHYDPTGAGILMSPRGIGSLLAMPLVTPLSHRVDARLLVGFGMALLILSLWMLTGLELDASSEIFIAAGFIQGFGVGFAFLPLTLMAYATLAPHLRTEGAAINSLARNVTSSVAVSVVGAMFVRNLQISHSDLAVHINPMAMPFLDTNVLRNMGATGGMVISMIDLEVQRQAAMIAYLDTFWITMWAAVLALPLIYFLKTRTGKAFDAGPIHMD
jgi:DHA2 family multidrug resistance protein